MKFKFFALFILVLIVPIPTMCQSHAQSTEVAPTPAPPLGTKLFPGGITTVGRTEEEAQKVFEECVSIIETSNKELPMERKQDTSEICQLNYFNDVTPPREVEVSSLYWELKENPQTTALDAEAACQQRGGRLPSAEEMEYLGNLLGFPDKEHANANIDWVGGNIGNPIVEECVYNTQEMCNFFGNRSEWATYINAKGKLQYVVKNGGSGTIIPFAYPEQLIIPEEGYNKAGYRCVYEVSK